MEPAEREAKLRAAAELVQLSGKLAEKGQWPSFAQHLDEAMMTFDQVQADLAALGRTEASPLRSAVGAAIHEAKGQLAMRANELAEAHFHLGTAARFRDDEQKAGGKPHPLPRGVTLLNLCSVAQRLGKLDEALAANEAAMRYLAEVEQAPGRVIFAASHQARGTLLTQAGRLDEALAMYDKAAAIADVLILEDLGTGRALKTEVLIHGARLRAQLGRAGEALAQVLEASEYAWQRLETSAFKDPEAASHYVTAQMNLVGFAETLGSFAQAEDALFRVLRLVGPDPRIVERGKRFYDACRTQADAALDAGNLPRDEVEESYAKLLAMVPSA